MYILCGIVVIANDIIVLHCNDTYHCTIICGLCLTWTIMHNMHVYIAHNVYYTMVCVVCITYILYDCMIMYYNITHTCNYVRTLQPRRSMNPKPKPKAEMIHVTHYM